MRTLKNTFTLSKEGDFCIHQESSFLVYIDSVLSCNIIRQHKCVIPQLFRKLGIQVHLSYIQRMIPSKHCPSNCPCGTLTDRIRLSSVENETWDACRCIPWIGIKNTLWMNISIESFQFCIQSSIDKRYSCDRY